MATLPRELDDGLVLRAARPDDADQLVAMNGALHAEPDADGADDGIAEWTRDLFDLAHPTFRVEDATVVEETATGRIVSTVCTIPQTWCYDGEPLAVGRPELVATEAAYRRRGLVRAQFDVLHERSDAAGEHLQFITGIEWYYRQFGYEYALDLRPQPTLLLGGKPVVADERWSVRPASLADVAFLVEVDSTASTRSGGWRCPRDAATWVLELSRRPGGNLACEVLVIEECTPASGAPEPAGYMILQRMKWNGHLPVRAIELLPGRSWLGPTSAVLALLEGRLREGEPSPPDGRPPVGATLALPAEHPALRCARTHVAGAVGGSYGLYVRVADLVGFVRAVTPALERRIASSPASGLTGEVLLDLYSEGLRLSWADGRLLAAEPWRPVEGGDRLDAGMPRDVFLHLLLGNRSLAEQEAAVADCVVETDLGALALEVLFPPMPLHTWWLG